jgi:hypothetical protein
LYKWRESECSEFKEYVRKREREEINIFLFKNIDEKVDLKQIESPEEIFK